MNKRMLWYRNSYVVENKRYALVTLPYDLSNGTTADGSQVKANDDTIANDYNGNIQNINIKASTGIDISKIDWSGADADIGLIRTSTTTNILSITGSSLTTGSLGYFYSNSASTSTRSLVSIINDHTAAVGAVPLNIQQDAAVKAIMVNQNAGAHGIWITQNSAASVVAGLYVDGNFTAGYGLSISAASCTTGGGINVTGSALTTGVLATFNSNSANTSARNLVSIVNDHTDATAVIPLNIQQDAAHAVLNIVGTAGNTTTDPVSTKTTSGSVTHHIQIEINGTKAWIPCSTTNPS